MALLVDGGIQANLPVEQARVLAHELGNDSEVAVIAINIDEPFETENGKTFRKIGSVSKRAINIMLASVDRSQTGLAQQMCIRDRCYTERWRSSGSHP